MSRSQLNIKISSELLSRVKSSAIKQGLTVTDFVCQALEEAASDEQRLSLEQRLRRIEEHLGLTD